LLWQEGSKQRSQRPRSPRANSTRARIWRILRICILVPMIQLRSVDVAQRHNGARQNSGPLCTLKKTPSVLQSHSTVVLASGFWRFTRCVWMWHQIFQE
jgi:hypothetical protein